MPHIRPLRVARLVLGVSLVVLLFGLGRPPQTSAASLPPYFFKETGHTLKGLFQQYWNVHGGLAQFGFPLTEEFQDVSTNGQTYTTQYFERAIFEVHPENTYPYNILQRLAGRILTTGRGGEKAFQPAIAPADAAVWYFKETGHTLRTGFKEYWLGHDGLFNVGFPISEETQEVSPTDAHIYTVQYFERARLEYHPEAPPAYRVMLGLLGKQLSLKANIPWEARTPLRPFDPAAPTPDFPIKGPHVGYGMNAYFYAAPFKVADMITNAGFNWVRQQVVWSQIEPNPGNYYWSELDGVIETAVRNNIHVMLSVVSSPIWARKDGSGGYPDDLANYTRFLSVLATRYQHRVEAYEMWNEPNIWDEAHGPIYAGQYVELLKAGSRGVKAVDPSAIVVFAGLAPNGLNDPDSAVDDAVFVEQCYQYHNGEIAGYFDVMGAHAVGYANQPEQLWPDNPGTGQGWTTHRSFYFRRAEDIRAIMVKHGDSAKQMWLTEFGWTTLNAGKGYEYGAQVTEQMQADYLVRAYQYARTNWSWMGVMFVWNFNFSTVVAPNNQMYPWSIVYADYSPRPAYTALKNMQK